MVTLVLDTHAIVWLMIGSARLSMTARNAIEDALRNGERLGVPSISLVEIAYLEEKGSLSKGTLVALFTLLDDEQTGLVEIPLTRHTAAVLQAVPRSDVPDMTDRIIAAHAMNLNVPLVTADARLQASQIPTLW